MPAKALNRRRPRDGEFFTGEQPVGVVTDHRVVGRIYCLPVDSESRSYPAERVAGLDYVSAVGGVGAGLVGGSVGSWSECSKEFAAFRSCSA